MRLDIQRSHALAKEYGCQRNMCQRNSVRVARRLRDSGELAVVIWGQVRVRNEKGVIEQVDHSWVVVDNSVIVDPTLALVADMGVEFENAVYFSRMIMNLDALEDALGIERGYDY